MNSIELAEDAASLMDFISACMTRYLTRIADGQSWRRQQLRALAKFTAEMKFLIRNISAYPFMALRNVEIALAAFQATFGDVGSKEDKAEEDPMVIHRRFTATLTNDPGLPRQLEYLNSVIHRVNAQRARVGLMGTLDYILISLLPRDRHRGFGVTKYEVCGVVMETGFEVFQEILLYQGRDFEYSSTLDGDQINLAHPAFRMLDSSISHLRKARKPPRIIDPITGTTVTRLERMYSDAGNMCQDKPQADFALRSSTGPTDELQSIAEIITAMALISLATPMVSRHYKHFLDMFYLTLDNDDLVRPFPERTFNAFVRLYTTDLDSARRDRLPNDFFRLADAVQSGLFSRTSLLSGKDTEGSS